MSTTPTPAASDLLESLRAIVGPTHVLVGDDLVAPFVTDWTRRYSGPCVAVVRPASTAEVSAVLSACSAAGQPVLVQGGNTGLVGGSVPARTGVAPVILSTRRLSSIGPVDQLTGQLTAGAGALLSAVQDAADAAGWVYGVDLAARDSATIGGTVATNAGGVNVIAYGMTRAQVVGIEAVLADGTVISHLNGLLKDNTGLDFGSLLCGAEGTLGVITAVRLRLHHPHARTSLAMIGCATYGEALELMSASARGSHLIAAEMVDSIGIELMDSVLGIPSPLASAWPVVAFIEVADGGDASGLPLNDSHDAVVALDATEQARLWQFRERQTEVYGAKGICHKLDVSVPLTRMEEVLAELGSLLSSEPTVEFYGLFGHIADGNIHVEFIGPDAADVEVDHQVLDVIAKYSGSISAEHGVGRMKVDSLHLTRSAEEIATMKAIKHALDPAGILNQGILFPPA